MKQFLCICLLAVSLGGWADDSIPPIIGDMQHRVTVQQSAAIDRVMMDLINGTEREQVQVQGFRVQIYSSNNQQNAKTEAYQMEKRIQESEITVDTYVIFNPPFWKVRLGDFRTQEDAALLKAELVAAFPDIAGDIYVVRDLIQVIE